MNMPTFAQATSRELLKRFPYPPDGTLEPPELKQPEWRRDIETLLRRDDVLTDSELRQAIREVIQQPGWIDDLQCRKRVGELLQQGDWQSEQQHLLDYIGMTLQSVSWQQDPEYRRQTAERLRRDDWSPLLAELLGFLQLLETAPSVALQAPSSQSGGPPSIGRARVRTGAELKERENEILHALLLLKAEGERRRVSREKASKKADPACKTSSYNRAIASLVKRGFVESQKGPTGGIWLTSEGVSAAKALTKPLGG
jgi:hypothetical protein